MTSFEDLSDSERSWILDQMSLYPSEWAVPVSDRLQGMNILQEDIQNILSELPGMIVIPETDEFDEIGWPTLDQPLWQMNDLNWSWVNPKLEDEDQSSKFYRYREHYLRANTDFTDESIKQLRIDTLRILDRCGNPNAWDGNKRGLVFGSIQSGKTASMEGLVCSALDSGFSHIFILTSNVENLRFQTQLRFRDSILSFSRNDNPYLLTELTRDLVDVSRDTPPRRRDLDLHVRAMKNTNSKFSFGIFKKHTSVLQGLKSIMERYFQGRNDSQESVLIIDDECDFASINTRHRRGDANSEQTRIHRLITEILEKIPRNTYVGYTATPQASILQSTQSKTFPRDFLWVLEPAKTYCGPRIFFDRYPEYLLEEVPAEDWVLDSPDGERPTDVQLHNLRLRVNEENPQNSLISATIDYVLSGAIRWWRCKDHNLEEKRKPHHAFMIHFSHLKSIHSEAEELSKITLNIVKSAFNDIFVRDFSIDDSLEIEFMIKNRIERINQKIDTIRDNPGPVMSLKIIYPYIKMILSETQHKKLDSSGRHKVILDYDTESEEDKVPLAMIVIGGNILSRGLTIKGLTVSYFLRSPKTKVQDSMLQQNRWYGHKLNYLDLCSVYIQGHIIDVLEQMTIADAELRQDLVDMIQYEMTPADSLLSLMSHPIFRPTNRSKLKLADCNVAPSFSGRNWQFQEPVLKGATADDNLWHFMDFIENRLGFSNAIKVGSEQGLLWEDVPLEILRSFLQDELKTIKTPWKIRPAELVDYLLDWEADGDLPKINIGFKFGKDGGNISERGRKMHNPTLEKSNPDSYSGQFKNLTRGRTERYFGDWYFDDYKSENRNVWFKEKQNRNGGTLISTQRKIGAPIFVLFYLLDPFYANLSPRVNLPGDHVAAGEFNLPVFITSLPPNGPQSESRWYNSEQAINPDIRYSGETGPVDENPMMR